MKLLNEANVKDTYSMFIWQKAVTFTDMLEETI